MDKQLLLRRLGIVLGVVLVVGAVIVKNKLSEQKEAPPRKEAKQIIPTVEILSASLESVPTALEVQGELVAFDKIDIFSEVPEHFYPPLDHSK